MNPNMMGQIPDVPPVKELWKNEKSKYRHWIILFGVSIIAVFILLLLGVIMSAINETSIKISVHEWFKTHLGFVNGTTEAQKVKALDNATTSYFRDIIIYGSVKVFIVFVGVVLYIYTIIISYKNNSFSHISKWSTFVIGFSAIIGVVQLFQIRGKPIFEYSEGIYDFVMYLIPIVIFIFISIPLNKIRRLFQISERTEAFKNSPQYDNYKQQMDSMQNMGQPMNGPMGPMGPMGPFGPINQPPVNNFSNTGSIIKDQTFSNEIKQKTGYEKRMKELTSMKVDELKKIAKKLSISGYYVMKKSELIDSIIRLSESN